MISQPFSPFRQALSKGSTISFLYANILAIKLISLRE
nr:MAG TPA: hypothetical protein [Caudoviricetes sp.]